MPARSAAVLALVLAGTLTACGGGGAPTNAPSTAAPTLAPTLAPTASPAAPKPTATPGPVAIADGAYVTGPIDVDEWRAAIAADDKLTEDEQRQIVETLFELRDHQTIVIKLNLTRGAWTQSAAFDGGAFDVGSTATYAFPDASTIVISEPCCGLTTFAVTPDGKGFRLRRTSAAPNELELITARLIFESQPFQPVP